MNAPNIRMAMVLMCWQLTSNIDKKSLCLTCRGMRSLVTPSLYTHMEVSVERLDSTLLNTLVANHPGLPHVRTLCIKPSKLYEHEFHDIRETHVKILCRLLFALPKDSLRRLE
jgi:hypothetical protein